MGNESFETFRKTINLRRRNSFMAIKLGQLVNGAAMKQTLDYVNNNIKNYVSFDSSSQKIVFSKPIQADVLVGSGNEATTSNIATENYVQTQISNLVNGAGASLDTLKELADALGNDANFASTVTTALGTKVAQADVSISSTLNSGTKIATVTVGSASADIYINVKGVAGANVSASNGTITVTVPRVVQDSVTPTANQTSFTLSKTPTANLVKLFVNGLVYIENKHFTVTRGTKKVTWTYTSTNSGFDFETTDSLLFEYETTNS
jgi:hypothetical protein